MEEIALTGMSCTAEADAGAFGDHALRRAEGSSDDEEAPRQVKTS